ncbi:serpin family protein [Candidatus Protochlamydia phocaeensis]|uniref:serpin family protein n=1 Tax=Candidatus Protochlamydia phocaeensis TaxID=1414722 RepID=UPI0008388828|nr:serpin family protein [Candidatus Protochlamydia phocaeensis]
MYRILLGLFCFFSFFLSLQAQEAPASDKPTPSVDNRYFDLLIQGQNQFAFDLLQQLKNRKGNLFFSPYSIGTGFALAAVGAKGQTSIEIQQALHYSLSLSPLIGSLDRSLALAEGKNATQLFLANAIWMQEGLPILPAYPLTLKRSFNFDLAFVDFQHEFVQSVKKINQWTASQTKGKINQLLNTADVVENAQLVLTTAIYMKGAWMHPFDLWQTSRAPFYTRDQYTTQVEMMHSIASYRTWVSPHFTLIEIPYEAQESGIQLAMIILLPTEASGWQNLEPELNADNWQKWRGGLRPQQLRLGLPRFRIEEKLDLNPLAQALGIKQIFTPQADYSDILEDKRVFLNKAVHKTLIHVDEKGTDAIGAPRIKANQKARPGEGENLQEISIDRPFYFFIIDQKTQLILFMGRVLRP